MPGVPSARSVSRASLARGRSTRPRTSDVPASTRSVCLQVRLLARAFVGNGRAEFVQGFGEQFEREPPSAFFVVHGFVPVGGPTSARAAVGQQSGRPAGVLMRELIESGLVDRGWLWLVG